MSLFPRAFVSPDATTSFSPLFRLLDEFDNYNKSTGNNHHQHRSHLSRSFNPKFDVKELADQYELHGELPGIEQKDIEIEFTDPQTLTIRGRTERSYHAAGNPATGQIEDVQKQQITEKGEPEKKHSATVEDEESAEARETTAVATLQQQEPQEPQAKYWVSERSVGEFHRSFSFPARVDLDAVTASMKNGVISIVVPKAKKAGGRKIVIS